MGEIFRKSRDIAKQAYMKQSRGRHTSVLLKKVIDQLHIKKDGYYIDATVGEGGHLRAMFEQGARVLGIDADKDQIQRLKEEFGENTNCILVHGNFKDIQSIAASNSFSPVDGVLFDFGLSYGQIERSGRGFSYKALHDPIDMRLDTDSPLTAETIINSYSEDALYEILARFSEELNSRAIAQGIVRSRTIKPIRTVAQLTESIDRAIKRKDNKVYARIFQALRIAVNNELENMKEGLRGAVSILKPDGIIAAISFHSIEDRVVKQFIKGNLLRELHKGVITGDFHFSFERSAKLRVFGKKIKD